MTSFLQSARGASYYTTQDDLVVDSFIENELFVSASDEDVSLKWAEVIDELLRVRNLPEDWDGQGAKAPTLEVVDTALKLVDLLRRKGCMPPDDYGAGVNGDITLGWHTEYDSLVVEVSSPLRVEGYRWARGAEKAEQFVLMTKK